MRSTLMDRLTTVLMWVGGALIVIGLSIWWRQSRADAASGRVAPPPSAIAAAAMTETPVLAESEDEAGKAPEVLPESPSRDGTPRARATARPRRTPSARRTATPTLSPTEVAGESAALESPPSIEVAVPTRIVIPAIGADVPVEEMGWNVVADTSGATFSEWDVPAFAAGWHKNSARLGEIGNIVLSGHHNIDGEVFRYIKDLQRGDQITLASDQANRQYVVEEVLIVKEKDEPLEVRLRNAQYMAPTPDERLTLISCHPYSTNTHRVIVVARPVAEPDQPRNVSE